MDDNVLSVGIGEAEWSQLDRITRALYLGASELPAIALRRSEVQRHWSVFTPWAAVYLPGLGGGASGSGLVDARAGSGVSGGPVEPELSEPVWVPAALLAHGAELSAVDGACELVLGEGSIAVANSVGSAHFEYSAPVASVPLCPSLRVGVPAADLTVAQLLHLLDGLGGAAADHTPLQRTDPDVWLGIEPGAVAATVIRAQFGGPGVTIRTPAWTEGTALTRIPGEEVRRVLSAFEIDTDLRLEVDADQHVLWLTGANWSAAVALARPPMIGPGESVEMP